MIPRTMVRPTFGKLSSLFSSNTLQCHKIHTISKPIRCGCLCSKNTLSRAPAVYPMFSQALHSSCKNGTLLFQKMKCNKMVFSRNTTTKPGPYDRRNQTGLFYITSAAVMMIGGSYAGVPLYRLFCQVSYLHLMINCCLTCIRTRLFDLKNFFFTLFCLIYLQMRY